MKRWVMAAKKADFNRIAEKYNISPMLARIIRNRDVISDEDIDRFLNGTVDGMHDPKMLKDIDKAAERIMLAIRNGENVRIIGDYDIDGICSSYILQKAFGLMGAKADVKLPDRIADGYGLNINLIDRAKEDNINLIVTCDNGIAAAREIEYASQLGIDVVVTDHHEVPYECDETTEEKRYILPSAVAVVDPKRQDCTYPFKGICGGMVAYKLVVYMVNNCCMDGTISSEIMEELLVFAAIATVGDVMELLDENRTAVHHGLAAIANCNNQGLKALIEVTGLDKNNISAYHIGFVLGPCMNATGRLDTAERALKLFNTTDYEQAVGIAQELKELNESRKNMTVMYSEQAIEWASRDENADYRVLVIYLEDCHESLAGIVAGRVRERFYKPAIVLTRGAEGVKGSGRSIEDYNMFEELTKVKDLFTKFGGHKMAAGLSMTEENIDILRQRLNECCTLSDEQLTEKFTIDIPLPVGYANVQFARELEKLAPFGVGNPKPLFAQKDVPIDSLKIIGKNQNVLKIVLKGTDGQGNAKKIDAVIFNDAQQAHDLLVNKNSVSILYQIDINSYMGRESVQLIIKDYY